VNEVFVFCYNRICKRFIFTIFTFYYNEEKGGNDMKIINPEFEVAKVISEETQRLFNQGYALTRFEHGGLNGNYRVLLFDNGNQYEDLKAILIRNGWLDEVYRHEIHESLFMEKLSFVTVSSGVISREDAQTMFLERIFEETQFKEKLLDKVIFNKKFFISYEEAIDIIEKRSKRNVNWLCETTEPHKFVVPRLKKVEGFKRKRDIVVTRSRFCYHLFDKNGKSKIIDFRTRRKRI
jgi:hypothetical protein